MAGAAGGLGCPCGHRGVLPGEALDDGFEVGGVRFDVLRLDYRDLRSLARHGINKTSLPVDEMMI